MCMNIQTHQERFDKAFKNQQNALHYFLKNKTVGLCYHNEFIIGTAAGERSPYVVLTATWLDDYGPSGRIEVKLTIEQCWQLTFITSPTEVDLAVMQWERRFIGLCKENVKMFDTFMGEGMRRNPAYAAVQAAHYITKATGQWRADDREYTSPENYTLMYLSTLGCSDVKRGLTISVSVDPDHDDVSSIDIVSEFANISECFDTGHREHAVSHAYLVDKIKPHLNTYEMAIAKCRPAFGGQRGFNLNPETIEKEL